MILCKFRRIGICRSNDHQFCTSFKRCLIDIRNAFRQIQFLQSQITPEHISTDADDPIRDSDGLQISTVFEGSISYGAYFIGTGKRCQVSAIGKRGFTNIFQIHRKGDIRQRSAPVKRKITDAFYTVRDRDPVQLLTSPKYIVTNFIQPV